MIRRYVQLEGNRISRKMKLPGAWRWNLLDGIGLNHESTFFQMTLRTNGDGLPSA
jgi:hypothetical protein